MRLQSDRNYMKAGVCAAYISFQFNLFHFISVALYGPYGTLIQQ